MQNQISNDKLILEGRKSLSLTNVSEVNAFNETTLKLTILDSKLTVLGENIKIVSFNKENGNFVADGIFNEIKYNYKKPTLIKRILK